jgi:L-rhamnose mutarotase
MERVCFLLQVRPDRLDEYRARHRAVWPEMLAALRDAGWSNYSLFLRDGGLLVGYVETDDFAAAQREFFELPSGERPDTGLTRLEEIFHLD